MTASRPRFWTPLLACVLVAIGLSLSGYLFLSGVLLVMGKSSAIPDICAAVFARTCDATLLSPSAEILGIPWSGWGLVYFAGLAALLVLGLLLMPSFTRAACAAAVAVCAVGIFVSVYLLAQFVLESVPSCPLCIGIHVVNLVLFSILVLMAGGRTQIVAAWREGLHFVLKSNATAAMSGGHALGLVAAALISALTYQWVVIRYERAMAHAEINPRPEMVLKTYVLSPRANIQEDEGDPTSGRADAPIRVVVFSDFQCGACKLFARRAHSLQESFPNFLSVTFKHFPLDPACNPLISKPLHDVACRAALDAEAARRAGRFWEFHDAVFNADAPLTAELLGDLEARFLSKPPTPEEAQADLARVRSNIEAAAALRIESTPTVFVNGRRLIDFSLRSLEVIATHELGVAFNRAAEKKSSGS